MVLQIGPHAGAVGDHRYPHFGQMGCGTNARMHQDFRRIDDRSRHNHLARGADHFDLVAPLQFNPNCAAIFDHHFARQTVVELHIALF